MHAGVCVRWVVRERRCYPRSGSDVHWYHRVMEIFPLPRGPWAMRFRSEESFKAHPRSCSVTRLKARSEAKREVQPLRKPCRAVGSPFPRSSRSQSPRSEHRFLRRAQCVVLAWLPRGSAFVAPASI